MQESKALVSVADKALRSGMIIFAREFYQIACKSSLAEKDFVSVAACFRGMAICAFEASDIRNSDEDKWRWLFERAKSLENEHGLKQSATLSYLAEAYFHLRSKRFHNALEIYSDLEQEAMLLGEHEAAATAKVRKAETLVELGEYDAAGEIALEYIQTEKETGPPLCVGIAYRVIANYSIYDSNPVNANKFILSSTRLHRQFSIELHQGMLSMAAILRANDECEQAEEWLKTGLKRVSIRGQTRLQRLFEEELSRTQVS